MPLAVISAPAGFFQIGQVNNATIEDLDTVITAATSASTSAAASAATAAASATLASGAATAALLAVSSVQSPLSTTTMASQTVAGPVTFSGVISGPTASPGTNTTQFATTAFVTAAVAPLAPLANPAFTVGVGIGGAGGPTWTSGPFVPVAAAPVAGSLYTRTAGFGGGVGATLYVSQGGGVWNPVAGV